MNRPEPTFEPGEELEESLYYARDAAHEEQLEELYSLTDKDRPLTDED